MGERDGRGDRKPPGIGGHGQTSRESDVEVAGLWMCEFDDGQLTATLGRKRPDRQDVWCGDVPGSEDELAGQGESEDVHGAATDQHGEAIFETRFQWMHSDEAEWIGGGDGARTWCGGGRVIAPGQLLSLIHI